MSSLLRESSDPAKKRLGLFWQPFYTGQSIHFLLYFVTHHNCHVSGSAELLPLLVHTIGSQKRESLTQVSFVSNSVLQELLLTVEKARIHFNLIWSQSEVVSFLI